MKVAERLLALRLRAKLAIVEAVERLLALPTHTKEGLALSLTLIGGAGQAMYLFSDLGPGETLTIRVCGLVGFCFLVGLVLGIIARGEWIGWCGVSSLGSMFWSMIALRNGYVGFALALALGSLGGLLFGGALGAAVRRRHENSSGMQRPANLGRSS